MAQPAAGAGQRICGAPGEQILRVSQPMCFFSLLVPFSLLVFSHNQSLSPSAGVPGNLGISTLLTAFSLCQFVPPTADCCKRAGLGAQGA